MAAGKAYLEKKPKAKEAANEKNRGTSGKSGKTGAVSQKKKVAAAAKTSKSKQTMKPKASADNKAKLKDKPAEQTDEVKTTAAVIRTLSTADLAAVQEHNTTSSQARLRLADVLKETLEEASIAADQDAALDSSSKTEEAGSGIETVEQTKARLVELYNQVSAIPAIVKYGYWTPSIVSDLTTRYCTSASARLLRTLNNQHVESGDRHRTEERGCLHRVL